MRQFLLSAAVVAMVSVSEVNSQTFAKQPRALRYALEVKESRRVTAVLTYNVSCPDLMAREWVIFAAVAPELPGQVKTKTVLSPVGIAAREMSPLARGLLVARVPVNNKEMLTAVPIQVTYEATLRSRALKALPAMAAPVKVTPLSPADRKLYLAEQGDMNFKQEAFKNWLQKEKLVRGTNHDDLEFALRSFLKIRTQMTYEYTSDMDRRASAVCSMGKSDCGGLSGLFVSVMRANEIPARTLYGRWAESAEKEAKIGGVEYFQWHVKAEFFAAGIGWVPVDMAGAILHDKSREGLAYFGVDPGDFIAFHIDPNLTLDTGLFGLKPIHNLQTPAFWVSGTGSTNPSRTTEDWKVKPLK